MSANEKILFVSTMNEDWGGSEELWSKSIPHLLKMGFKVTACKTTINVDHPEFKKLAEQGVELVDLKRYAESSKPILNPISKSRLPFKKKAVPQKASEDYDRTYEESLGLYLKQNEVSLVVISQGINFDGLGFGYACLIKNVPYALLAQKAAETHWPSNIDRVAMRNVYLNAKKTFFVSKHNLRLTEEQFGVRFRNAEIVNNPVKTARYCRNYPDTKNGFRLACIGRFFLLDKGQDILLRILSQPKWQKRPVKISFIGKGDDQTALEELANLLKVKNVEFLEYQDNIERVWDNFHALILPSRFEGSPLALLEAMSCGRIAIASTAGGNSEILIDGETGFLGEPTEVSFEQAMERAWAKRHEWQTMGEAACERLKKKIPALPELEFAKSLKKVAEEKLVSVIIPTYNRAGLVEQAIQSVLRQTYPFIQIIVADDGSTDNTPELFSKYPQVTFLQLDHGGQAHARNNGLKQAKGEYIATLDSDDTWEPDFIEKSLKIIEENNLDFFFSNWLELNEEGEMIERFTICEGLKSTLSQNKEKIILLDNSQLRKIYLTGCPSPSSSLLIRRRSLPSKWSSEFRIADDWCLLMEMIFNKNCKAGFTREILWNKNRDGKNIYDGKDRIEVVRDLWVHDMTKLFSKFKNRLSKEEKEHVKFLLSHNYVQHSYYELRMNKKFKSSLKYSVLALMANKQAGLFAIFSALRKFKSIKNDYLFK
ncbi:glycosyltransferase [Autumnicola edwardsiae]|uniref:Glycosyltransferase n=1 Tax=Autumnicola edwardsiae TaxID=3075594 RepID=A0ABU3CX82_9FLAO|nr:glycosyltransferase [Zunongwangia sp. F297]MDT0650500.1 glycosyltransferase [Zunongwangia sp. F297]